MKKFYYEKKKEICLSDDEDDEPWEKFYTQTYFGKEKKKKQ
jgi:phage repressor protein C with HTH and peptisase S24 domain